MNIRESECSNTLTKHSPLQKLFLIAIKLMHICQSGRTQRHMLYHYFHSILLFMFCFVLQKKGVK